MITSVAEASRTLIQAGLDAEGLETLVLRYGHSLQSIGLDIIRVWHSALVLHPIVGAVDAQWWAQTDSVDVTDIRRSRIHSADLPGGPKGHPSGHPGEYRCRLDTDTAVSHKVLAMAREAGATEYILLQTQQDGVPTLITSYSFQGGQLDAEQMKRLRELHSIFGVVALLLRERQMSRVLLHTYLGRDAGDRVLAGSIERGDGFTVNAAILFSDLRNFTGLSEEYSREAILDLLSDAFEVQVNAIEAHQGQVLKFIGDGLLAIFPDDAKGAHDSCSHALQASFEVETRVAQANQEREARGALPIKYNLSLHHGEVVYGNIGASHRLDFTVIGPAVNRAARLESLGAKHGITPSLSAEFASQCGAPVALVGSYPVKGIDSLELWKLT